MGGPCLVEAGALVEHAHILVVTDVWRRLLVALVVAESHRHLMHIQGPIEVV